MYSVRGRRRRRRTKEGFDRGEWGGLEDAKRRNRRLLFFLKGVGEKGGKWRETVRRQCVLVQGRRRGRKTNTKAGGRRGGGEERERERERKQESKRERERERERESTRKVKFWLFCLFVCLFVCFLLLVVFFVVVFIFFALRDRRRVSAGGGENHTKKKSRVRWRKIAVHVFEPLCFCSFFSSLLPFFQHENNRAARKGFGGGERERGRERKRKRGRTE